MYVPTVTPQKFAILISNAIVVYQEFCSDI